MNNSEKKFEERVSGQPLRAVPAEWRGEILAAARVVQAVPEAARTADRSFLSTINSQLSTLLWPHPKAWAGLAAVWVGIIALNIATHEGSPRVAGKSTTTSPEMVAELRKQQRMFAELVGGYESTEADRPRTVVPRPRSERERVLIV